MKAATAGRVESSVEQRLTALRRMGDVLRSLDHVQIAGDVPPSLSERLGAPRYRARLERRFSRRTGLTELPGPDFDAPVLRLAEFGPDGLRSLIVDAGVICQYAVLRRIVDQSFLADLSGQIGLDVAMHEARKATDTVSLKLARAVASPEPSVTTDTEAIIHAILADGLHCWNCWVHNQPHGLTRFFEALLPSVPNSGAYAAGGSCKPHECRRRADLFDARITAALPDTDEAPQGNA